VHPSADSPYDRFIDGNRTALTAEEQTGLQIFRGKGNCTACHMGPTFSDERFHNTGIAWRDGRLHDGGRAAVTSLEADRGAFKTPTLREISRTAPYMHDGSLGTLEDVVEYYDRGGNRNSGLDPELRLLKLTDAEKRALAAFLHALTGTVVEGPHSDRR
jgi:cytochrome c peroxidase